MNSCQAAKAIKALVKDKRALAAAEGCFDLIPALGAGCVHLPKTERFIPPPRPLTVLVGPNGTGKTQILEELKDQADRPAQVRMRSRASDQRRWPDLSAGQLIRSVGELLVDRMPVTSCLLIDDALEKLDDENLKGFVEHLLASKRTAILTVKPRTAERLFEVTGPLRQVLQCPPPWRPQPRPS